MTFCWTTRILFIDTDASGRIHYTALFRYFEAAEIEFFRAVGMLHETAFPRVHVECDYRAAITYDDVIEIEVSVGKIGNSSIQLKFGVMKAGVEAARGIVVIASMDRQTQKAAAVPADLRARLQPYLSL